MTPLAPPIAHPGAPYRLDPLIDAPLVGPRVLSLVGDDSGCTLWRVWWPTAMLRTFGYPCDWVHVRDPHLHDVPFFAYQAIVLCRLHWPRAAWAAARKSLRGFQRRGLRVFLEADDDLFTPFMVEQQLGRINAEKTCAELEADRAGALWLLELCDGVTVSTQHLASTVRRYTAAPVEVVPNAIDHDWFLARQRGVPRPVPGLTIGWAGGNRPDADLEPMARAWGRIAARFPDVTFIVAGHDPPIIREHVPPDRLVQLPWVAAADYPKSLVGIDIGCCPLEATPFSRCKTAIKSWEYALSGAAVVASPTVYRQSVRHAQTGFLATTADEWEAAIGALVENPARRQTMALALQSQVLERWTLRANYWRWPLSWNRLMGGGEAQRAP